jgi:hypothetical protein
MTATADGIPAVWLCVVQLVAVTYFLILLNSQRYWGHFPLITEVLSTLINLAIFAALIIALCKVYKSSESKVINDSYDPSSALANDADRQKIRIVWVAAVSYFIMMVIAIPRAAKLPYQVLLLSAVLNLVVIIGFIIALRKLHLRTLRR